MKYPIQVLFREYFEGILAAIFLALFLRFFVISVLYMPTNNMEPGLVRGDFIIGWRLSYGFPLPLMKGERLNFKVPSRGDLISFRFPGDDEQVIIRRVVGMPGDRVAMQAGRVMINGKALDLREAGENGLRETAFESGQSYGVRIDESVNLSELVVPENRIFVLSDDRSRSDDSRDWGFVPLFNIESRISLIWLSISNDQGEIQINWPRLFKWVN